MRIAKYLAAKKLVVEDIPMNKVMGDLDVHIRSLYSGISHGTEMNVYRGVAPFFSKQQDPVTRLFVDAQDDQKWEYPIRSCDPGVWYLGYSLVGEVISVGKSVTNVKVGDVVYCNASHQSEHILPASAVMRLPNGLDPKYGTVLTNLMTAFNGILDSSIKLGDVVVVSGLGIMGQMLCQMALMSGGEVYGIDVIAGRRQAAIDNGVAGVFDPRSCDVAAEIRKVTENRGADVVIEASGNSAALNEAIRIVAPERTVVALSWYQGTTAINLADEFHHNRVKIKCSQTNFTAPEFAQIWPFERKENFCVNLLPQLELKNLITNVYDFSEIATAYSTIDLHPQDVIQCVLRY